MKMNPKSIENLKKRKSWKKGQSGNPRGRPKELKKIRDIIEWVHELDAPSSASEAMCRAFGLPIDTELSNHHITVLTLVREAWKGNVRAAEFLVERLEGKVADILDVTARKQVEIVEEIIDGGYRDARTDP